MIETNIKAEASSLIRINEATRAELQLLSGIGPRRAGYIDYFRQEVGPVSNAFDLATAAGISVKAAEQIASQIDWQHQQRGREVTLFPFGVTILATLWLVFNGFVELTSDTLPTDPLYVVYRIGLSLVLLGGLVATADIGWASLNRNRSETTRLFKPALLSFAAGLTVLCLVITTAQFTDIDAAVGRVFNATGLFLILTITMGWLLFGPAVSLRLLVGQSGLILRAVRLIYDSSQILIGISCCLILLLVNGDTWLEEIFCGWLLVIITSGGLELMRGHTAFMSMMSKNDRERHQFALRHQMPGLSQQHRLNRSLGMGVLAVSALLAFVLIDTLLVNPAGFL